MSALITKDLLTMRKIGIKIGFTIVLYVLIFSSMGNSAFQSAIIIMFSAMVLMNTFAYDELAKWDIYLLSLPVTKKQIVLSRYLLGFLFIAVGCAVSALLALLSSKMDSELPVILYCFFALSLCVLAFMMPLLYKFGTQKARLWIILFCFLPTAAATILSELHLSLPSFGPIDDSTSELLLALVLPVSLLLYAGSYFLSCRIFQNKEI